MSVVRQLLDSNVAVCAYDAAEPAEQAVARISYGDALIIAAAERSGSKTLLSEDLNPDQRYSGIVVVNTLENVEGGAPSAPGTYPEA